MNTQWENVAVVFKHPKIRVIHKICVDALLGFENVPHLNLICLFKINDTSICIKIELSFTKDVIYSVSHNII